MDCINAGNQIESRKKKKILFMSAFIFSLNSQSHPHVKACPVRTTYMTIFVKFYFYSEYEHSISNTIRATYDNCKI